MPHICFVQRDGSRDEAMEESGLSVMRAAINNGIRGIVAECGGNKACGTCHVYVGDETLALLQPPGDEEQELLEFTASPRTQASRLSCQIMLSESLEGAVFFIPERQI